MTAVVWSVIDGLAKILPFAILVMFIVYAAVTQEPHWYMEQVP